MTDRKPRRHFPPPWASEELAESFVVRAAPFQPLAYVYFEDEPMRQSSMKRLSRDEARRIAPTSQGCLSCWQSDDAGRVSGLVACAAFSIPPLGGVHMPLYRLLQEAAFSPEMVAVMSTAFEDACNELKLSKPDVLREVIARRIIEVARTGERDPIRMRDQVLKGIKGADE